MKTILVIDDDPGVLILAEEVFTQQGYRVICVSSGKAALECIEDKSPDLILLDIMMPGIDGYETCQRIKALPRFKHTPVIMLTGREDSEAVERAYDSGSWDFTAKPVNWPMLTNRVRHAMRASEAFANENRAAQLSRAIDSSPNEVLTFEGGSLKITAGNASARLNLAYSSAELSELTMEDIATSASGDALLDRIARLKAGEQIKLDVQMRRKDGSSYPSEGILIHSPEEGGARWIGIFQDISERREAEEALYRLAFYDDLTGLPNRRLLQEHVDRAIAVAQRRQRRCALCILDLDGFKRINDTLGHNVGDLLLKEVADRLETMLRPYDVVAHEPQSTDGESESRVARLGGDEFILLLTELDDSLAPARIAARVLKEISLPYNVHKTVLNITGSIGISMYPDDGENLDELMMHADMAMYKAKQAGKNSFAFFTQDAGHHTTERLKLESELRCAIENCELELHYQPQLDHTLNHLVGAEALLRWRHPERGLLYPDTFIPLAEETGLIISIGDWVLRHALEQLQRWSAVFRGNFKMAVNVSGHQFRSEKFLPMVSRLLEEYSVARDSLVIELTESVLMGRAESSEIWLKEIKAAGVEIAIDDFGTGYSSLGYLQKFPIDYVKVDRSFVTDLENNRASAAIVKAIFHMSQALEINLTVEGVETHAQLKAVSAMGDSTIQGWLISKALEPQDFLAFAEPYNAATESKPQMPEAV